MSDATASFNALIGRIAKLEDEWRDFLLADSFSSFFVSGFFGGVRPTLSIERRTPFLIPLFQHYVFSTVMVDFPNPSTVIVLKPNTFAKLIGERPAKPMSSCSVAGTALILNHTRRL